MSASLRLERIPLFPAETLSTLALETRHHYALATVLIAIVRSLAGLIAILVLIASCSIAVLTIAVFIPVTS